jgi:ORF 12 gene product N-terminal
MKSEGSPAPITTLRFPDACRLGSRMSRRAVFALFVAVIAVAVSACSRGAGHGSAQASVSFPDTAAGRQARWLFAAVRHLPIADSAIAAHFDRAYLALLPAPAAATLNAGFAGIQHLRLDAITISTPRTLVFLVTKNGSAKRRVRITVDGRGLISHLRLEPAGGAALAPPVIPPTATYPPSTIPAPRVRQIPSGSARPRSGGRSRSQPATAPSPRSCSSPAQVRTTKTRRSARTSRSGTSPSAWPRAAPPPPALAPTRSRTRQAPDERRRRRRPRARDLLLGDRNP